MHHVLLSRLPAILIALTLAGCERPAPPGPPAEQAQAALRQLEQDVQNARASGQDEAALLYAEDILKRFPSGDIASKWRAEMPGLRAAAERQRERKRLAGLWTYHAIAAAGGVQYTAYIFGHSDAPQAPALRLVLRRHPEWGQNSYLLIGDGADFSCQGVCKAALSFDGAAARAFEISRADDADPPAVFIEDDAAVFTAIESAKTLLLSLPLDAGSTVEYRFELGGYASDRMQAPTVPSGA